jgi:WD40 repeat protein
MFSSIQRFLLVSLIFLCLTVMAKAQENVSWARITPENADELDLVESINIDALLGLEIVHIDKSQVSADGHYLAMLLADHRMARQYNDRLLVFDLYEQAIIFNLELIEKPLINELSISSDGKWLAFSGNAGQSRGDFLQLYEVQTESLVQSWDSYVIDGEFSQDNQHFVFSYSNKVMVWSLESSEPRFKIELSLNAGAIEGTPIIAISPDNQFLAVSTGLQFRLYELSSGNQVFSIEFPISPAFNTMVGMLFVGETGKVLISHLDGGLYLVNTETQDFEKIAENEYAVPSQMENEFPHNVFGIPNDDHLDFVDFTSMETLSSISSALVLDVSMDNHLSVVEIGQLNFGDLHLIAIETGELLFETSGVIQDAFISPAMDYFLVIASPATPNIYAIE